MKATTLPAMAALLCLASLVDAHAQRQRPQPVESPIVHPDRTVTFHFRAPDARKVELSAQFIRGNQPMQTNAAGLWSLTLGPVEPNLYPYNFVPRRDVADVFQVIAPGFHEDSMQELAWRCPVRDRSRGRSSR